MASSKLPTRKTPEPGWLLLLDQPITQAEHWVEDGLHYVYSTDFGLTVSDEDFDEVLLKLGEAIEDYLKYLEEIPPKELADNERAMLGLIRKRFSQAIEALDRIRTELERHRLPTTPASRQPVASHWYPVEPSKQNQYSKVSVA